jgi:hypothetical protein
VSQSTSSRKGLFGYSATGGTGTYIVNYQPMAGSTGRRMIEAILISGTRTPAPPPPPPSGSSGLPHSGVGPGSPEHKKFLAFLQNENITNMSDLERLKDELIKSQSIQSTELAVIQAVDSYISNMSLYRDDITQNLDKKVIPNLQKYRRVTGEREGQLVKLRLLIPAMNNRINLYNKLAEDIQNGKSLDVVQEETYSANLQHTKDMSAYNATGRVMEQPVSQQVFAFKIQRPLPLLQLPSAAGPGNSTNTSISSSSHYGNSTINSISSFSDYKGKIASWTESFASFEN